MLLIYTFTNQLILGRRHTVPWLFLIRVSTNFHQHYAWAPFIMSFYNLEKMSQPNKGIRYIGRQVKISNHKRSLTVTPNKPCSTETCILIFFFKNRPTIFKLTIPRITQFRSTKQDGNRSLMVCNVFKVRYQGFRLLKSAITTHAKNPIVVTFEPANGALKIKNPSNYTHCLKSPIFLFSP